MGKSPKRLTADVKAILRHHPWEGNVRELRNVMERAVIFFREDAIGIDLMPPEVTGLRAEDDGRIPLKKIWEPGDSIETAICRVESHIIDDALERCGHNKTKAAEMMGISRFALGRRLERLEKYRTIQGKR